MPELIVTMDSGVSRKVELSKDRTTIGRRPYNDLVIDSLIVSGEHAALHLEAGLVYLEDLNSTNGTFVNGKSVKRQQLHHGDNIEIGKCKIGFVQQIEGVDALAVVSAPVDLFEATPAYPAAIKVLSGAGLGRELALTKAVTTLGKPGVAVAIITRAYDGYTLSHSEGATRPTLNGTLIGIAPVALKDGDLIELAGTQMRFFRT